ncbi:MAG: rod shape-determining protein MreC, partial [Alphaproteobacteria bacterium]
VVGAFATMLMSKADLVVVERFRSGVLDAVVPVYDILSRPAATVADLVAEVRATLALHTENARLRAENARLLGWQATARRLTVENNAFRALLAYVPEADAGYVAARVVADPGGAFARSVLINAGGEAGVRKGQAAINDEGLVGRVAQTGRRAARVLLITDLNSRIPVMIESSAVRAILAGDNSNRPRLEFLAPGARVAVGDRIVTSGHAGAFPPGLPVGTVVAAGDAAPRVQPFIESHWLEYVRIVDFGLGGILPDREGIRDESGRARLP